MNFFTRDVSVGWQFRRTPAHTQSITGLLEDELAFDLGAGQCFGAGLNLGS